MAIDYVDREQHRTVPDELLDMPATVNLHSATWTLNDAPKIGDVLESCRLVAELGFGSSGHAYLAQQSGLGDRPLVLKVTNTAHNEHLNLARLQHTHIMPLYWATTHPYTGVRILAMPYLARTNLACLLERLSSAPRETWDGQRVFTELRKDQEGLPVQIPPQDHFAQILKESSWVDFVLRIGQTVAEALAFAHQRNLVHLDVKPSNILITPDGQPILLDLDVAHQPITAGTSNVSWLGGTPGFMSPEQEQAMDALARREPIPQSVDERSDVYSLGMVLCHALSVEWDAAGQASGQRVFHLNPHVGQAVADLLTHCLAEKPADRYRNCSDLAADLERHLNNLPLLGVRNRWADRWRKWRRRRPLGLPLAILGARFCAALGVAGLAFQEMNAERRTQAESALLDGQDLLRRGHYEAAARRLSAGQDLAAQAYGAGHLHQQLTRRLLTAQRLQHAQELDQAVRLMRYCALEDQAPHRMKHVLEAAGRKLWHQRGALTDRSAGRLERVVEEKIDSQLQELMLLWTDLQMRLAPASHAALVRSEVRQVIDRAEEQFGPSFAVQLARRQHGMDASDERLVPRTAWDQRALGHFALRRGDLAQAEVHLRSAFEMDAFDPISNFYVGVLALRAKRYAEAVPPLSFCLGADPFPECFALRGEAFLGMGENEHALRDLQQALARNPQFAHAYRQRGRLYESMGRLPEARQDLNKAKQLER